MKMHFYMQPEEFGKEAKALFMYAFANNVLESVRIPEIKQRVKTIIAIARC